MTLRRFISQSGKPAELLCDQGTNHIKFHLLHLVVIILASKMISHCWECEIQSVNAALTTVLVLQVLSKEVLTTVLVELEGVFN